MVGIINLALLAFLFLTVYFYLSFRVEKKKNTDNQEESNVYKKINNYLGKVKEGYFSKEKIEKKLKSYGNEYGITAVGYISSKIAVAVIILIASFVSRLYLAGIVLSIVAFFLLDLFLYFKDKSETKNITFDLRNIYDTFVMQITAGANIKDCLSECYLVAYGLRLKKALAELTTEINTYNNIDKALDNFNEKFCSEHIDTFVLTIKQSLKTGQSLRQIKGIRESTNGVNLIAVQDITKKIPNKVSVIQLQLFAGLMATVVIFVLQWLQTSVTGILK